MSYNCCTEISIFARGREDYERQRKLDRLNKKLVLRRKSELTFLPVLISLLPIHRNYIRAGPRPGRKKINDKHLL
jgi:hypothetical protein